MKYCNSIIRACCFGALLLGMASLWSCNVDDKADVSKVELGAVLKNYEVDAEAGEIDVEVYANLPFDINYLKKVQWARLSTTSLSGDSKFTVSYDYNEEFPRMLTIILTNNIDTRSDTIRIKQKGMLQPTLSMANSSVIAAGAGGEQRNDINCNVPTENVEFEIIYSDDINVDWVSDVSIDKETQKLVIVTDANTSEDKPRTAAIRMSYVDGWGILHTLRVNLTQRTALEGLGREIAFNELYDMYESGETIDEFVSITGIVVSDKNSLNAGEAVQTTNAAINYTGTTTTVYLQNLDGSLGYCIRTATPADNVFERYSTVQFLLKGAVLNVMENPKRYILSGVTAAMATSNIAGNASDVAVKEKYMNELTDEDIYTWVTLKDCEIPVRKGALVPCNEGYTTATNAHRLTKYPLLLRDKNGDDMYMYTNTNCTFRNDGSVLPYGSGKISGVVVHEKFIRFVYEDADDEDDYGNIGTYQIRPMSKDDIWGKMEKSVENSFSGLLAEYRFQNSGYDGTAKPTYGTNGWLTHTNQQSYTGVPNTGTNWDNYGVPFGAAGEFCYLGPIGNGNNAIFGKHVGNINGCGIILDLTKEHYNTEMEDWISRDGDKIEWAGPNAANTACIQVNYPTYPEAVDGNAGKGTTPAGIYSTFATSAWWNATAERPHAWIVSFSTENLSTDQLSMQISVINTTVRLGARYWKVEWSTVNSMKPEDDNKWNLIDNYTVPDLSDWSASYIYSLAAYKNINFKLPQEMLGKENVYIRLWPADVRAGTESGYSNGFIYNGTATNSLAYLAIRYNK